MPLKFTNQKPPVQPLPDDEPATPKAAAAPAAQPQPAQAQPEPKARGKTGKGSTVVAEQKPKNAPAVIDMAGTALDGFLPEESEQPVLPDAVYFGPYMAFMHPQNTRAQEVYTSVPGVQDGEPILFLDGEIRRPEKGWKYVVLREHHYFGVFDASGKLVESSPVDNLEDGKECYEAQLLVIEGKTAIPVQVRVRSGTIGLLSPVLRDIIDAGTPEWATKSDAHGFAASACKVPRLRVMGTTPVVTMKTSKQGMKYAQVRAVSAPIDADALLALAAWMKDADAQAYFAEIVRPGFEARVGNVQKVLVTA